MSKTLLLSIVVLSTITLAGCSWQQKNNTTTKSDGAFAIHDRDLVKGLSLSPKSFEGADFTNFFVTANSAADVISWVGDIEDIGKSNGAPKVVVSMGRSKDFSPLIEVSYFNTENGALIRPLDEATRNHYKDLVRSFVQNNKVPYFGIGVEADVLLVKRSAQDFDTYVAVFNELATVIHEVSPDTVVFPVFQLERLKGLQGGLFGGKNDPSTARWNIIERFTEADAIAFTTYPGLIYKTPGEIPDNYYSEISEHVSKPTLFTEIGWPSQSIATFTNSEASQSAYVDRLFTLMQDLKPKVLLWSFLYDQKTAAPFDSMGLIKSDGTEKEAFANWKNK